MYVPSIMYVRGAAHAEDTADELHVGGLDGHFQRRPAIGPRGVALYKARRAQGLHPAVRVEADGLAERVGWGASRCR